MKPTLYILSGASGSGKTTLAKKMLEHGIARSHHEADHFFEDLRGENYKFDRKSLGIAHSRCQYQIGYRMMLGYDVIVSNTFTTVDEMKPYLTMAVDEGYNVHVIRFDSALYQSIHDVPDEVLKAQKTRIHRMSDSDIIDAFHIMHPDTNIYIWHIN